MSNRIVDYTCRKNKWSEHCTGLNNVRNGVGKKDISLSRAANIGDGQGRDEVYAERYADGSWAAERMRPKGDKNGSGGNGA